MASVRTVHFPQPLLRPCGAPAETKESPVEQCRNVPNVLEAYRDAAIGALLVSEKLKTLFVSDNRHGDLQVCRSALLSALRALDRLIEEEQTR